MHVPVTALALLASALPPVVATEVHITVGPGKVFVPQNVTISKGDTMLWEFAGGYHNIEQSEGSSAPCNPLTDVVELGFTSGEPVSHGTYEHTFTEAGIFAYRCSVGDHCKQGQWGIITVR